MPSRESGILQADFTGVDTSAFPSRASTPPVQGSSKTERRRRRGTSADTRRVWKGTGSTSDSHSVKQVHLRPTGVLHTNSLAPSNIGEHPKYFRPRPALDQDWFQIPKPPKLAYQREQFFANLLKKAHRGRTRTLRRSAYSKVAEKQADMTEKMQDVQPAAGGKQSALRITGGFVGVKLTQGKSHVARPGTSPGCMRFPTETLFTPNPVTADIQEKVVRAHSASLQHIRQPRTSTVFMTPSTEPEDQTENADNEHHQKWVEMCTMSECHHQDLNMMKSEIQELREELERGLRGGSSNMMVS